MKDLNFFSIYQGSIKEKKDEKIYIYIIAGIVAIAIFTSLTFNIVKLVNVNNKIKYYVAELSKTEIQNDLKEAEIINDKQSILNEYEGSLSNVIKSIKGTDLIDDELLIDISGAVPKDISFTEWKMDNFELIIKGTTHTRSAVAEFEHNLKNLPQFKLVHVDKIKTGETVGDDFTFEMTCILKEVE